MDLSRPVWRSAQWRNGQIAIEGDQGVQPVFDRQGRPFESLRPGWAPASFLDLGGRFGLLNLLHEDSGAAASWLLDAEGRRLGDVAQLTKAANPAVAQAVGSALAKAFAGALAGGRAQKELDARKHAGLNKSAFKALRALASPGKVQALNARDGRIILPASALEASKSDVLLDRRLVTARLEDFIAGLANPVLTVPGLDGRTPADQVRHIPLGRNERHYTALIVRDTSESAPYIRIFRTKLKVGGEAIYFPQDDRLFLAGDFAESEARNLIGTLQTWIFMQSAESQTRLLASTQVGGLLVRGIRNFGHGIWDEMQALDRVVASRASWKAEPWIYILEPESGAALYGDLEDVYPELRGRILTVASRGAAINHALANGVQIYNSSGRLALAATRRRMERMAFRHGEAKGLVAAADAMPRPTIALGLRLTNRRPVDLLGFYTRLTQALCSRFGAVGVVIDGLNREEGQTKSAAKIFNGAVRRSEGQDELEEEQAFVEAYQLACRDLPAKIVNCVGRPIRENLYWLNQVDFFVAPNGGGLAKLRWAMDKPGYVLSSRINFDYCSLVNVYADAMQTEAPFSDLHMNSPEDVTDVPLDPPRAGPPAIQRIPHPDNFILNEAAVIPEICALVDSAMKLARQTGPQDDSPRQTRDLTDGVLRPR